MNEVQHVFGHATSQADLFPAAEIIGRAKPGAPVLSTADSAHPACSPRSCQRHPSDERGFTLIEIMVVVGIMGVLLTLGVPLVYNVTHKQPMARAISEIVEVCSNARARAILSCQDVYLVIHPRDGRFEVSGGSGSAAPAGDASGAGPAIRVPGAVGSGLSAQLSDRIRIEDLDINLIPGGFREAEVAKVCFRPNGTSDEMRLFLASDRNERCEILLEVTTGLATVEHNVSRFR